MRALDTNKLKAEIIRQLEYLSEWTDNGECREYNDINTERATEIADEIIKECEGDTQPDTGSGLHLADVGHHVKIMDWKAEGIPMCYRTGDWDGKASDLCLCQDNEGDYFLAKCYEYENNEFEWYDKDDFGLRHDIAKWALLE